MPLKYLKKKIEEKKIPLINDLIDYNLLESDSKTTPVEQSSTMKDLIVSSSNNLLYFLLTQAGFTMSYFIVSHLGDTLLVDAVGVGNTWLECTVLAPIFSLNLGLGTLVAQAFGANQHKLVGLYLQRSVILVAFTLIFSVLLLGYANPLLRLMGYEDNLLPPTVMYVTYLFFSCVFSCCFDLMKNFCQAVNVFDFPSYVQCVFTIIDMIAEYIVVLKMGHGIGGLVICKTICEFLKTVTMMIYLLSNERFNSIRQPLDKEVFEYKGLTRQFKMQFLAGAVMLLDWLGFLGISFLVSGLDVTQVASFFISLSIINIFWCVPCSISGPLGVLIGAAAGEGNIQKAKDYVRSALKMGTIVVAIMAVLLFLGSRPLALLFSDDAKIDDLVTKSLYLFCIMFPSSILQAILSAVARSIGKEEVGSGIFFVCIYLIGLPMCYYFGYPAGYGVLGIRFGYGIGITINAIALAVLVYKSNFTEQILAICKRVREEQVLTSKDENAEYYAMKNE